MLQVVMILLSLSGVFTENWNIDYPSSKVCAVRGFDAIIPCNYSYPLGNKVVQMLWCSMKNNIDRCVDPPYIYDSKSTTTSDFVYTGDDQSDCTLLIRNVQSSYSAEYRFRFITDKDRYTGVPGVTLELTDLKVSLIRISGNGTIKQGDSLNLTCDVKWTHSSPGFVWSKNNEKLKQSGPVLHFPNLTVGDSGNYTCTWKSNQNSRSDSIFLSVEVISLPKVVTVSADGNSDVPDSAHPPVWIIIVVVLVVGVILIGLVVVAVIYSRRRKVKSPEQKSRQSGEGPQDGEKNCPQLSRTPQSNEAILHEEEVAYASVWINPNIPTKENIASEKQKEDVFVIYSGVKSQ